MTRKPRYHGSERPSASVMNKGGDSPPMSDEEYAGYTPIMEEEEIADFADANGFILTEVTDFLADDEAFAILGDNTPEDMAEFMKSHGIDSLFYEYQYIDESDAYAMPIVDDITEGMELTVNGQSHGRYFIRSRGAGEGTTGITDATADGNGDVSVYSVERGRVVVSSGAGLRSVDIYSVGGSLLKREDAAAGQTALTIDGVDSGMAVVRVATAEGTETRKIVVK